jgi:drug/metabolite transporter (DMT)-like permease
MRRACDVAFFVASLAFTLNNTTSFSPYVFSSHRSRKGITRQHFLSRHMGVAPTGEQTEMPADVPGTAEGTIKDGGSEQVDRFFFPTAVSVSPTNVFASMSAGVGNNTADEEYKRGLLTIGFITLIFSSNSPALHAAFSGTDPPPVLLLNAAVSVVALVGLVLGGESLETNTLLPSALKDQALAPEAQDALAFRGGCELGLWKFLGTTANLYGLSLTTASHGALLIQLTTLIVPIVQGIQGVPIPRRIQLSVLLALAGVVCFTQDPTGTPSAYGDALCVVAAGFYAAYDLRLFSWGKKVSPRRLITSKIATQAILSLAFLASLTGSWNETVDYLSSDPNWALIVPVVLWSGVAVNALAPFLQVGGQQAVGPTRCQTIYASQPLWAGVLSFFFLQETFGVQGLVGGAAFLSALFLAATTDAPDANCGESVCEV